jgi:hypothetical protein
MVLPPLKTMRPEVLQKIEQLVAAGAVIIGQPPQTAPGLHNYPQADQQVQALAAKMWQDTTAAVRTYGKGKIFKYAPLSDVFKQLGVAPDCSIDTDADSLPFIHRSLSDGTEIYFISNQGRAPKEFTAVFRAGEGRQPELWDPVQGTMRNLPAFAKQGDAVSVPLRLERWGSAFIVFRHKGKATSNELAANFPELKTVAETENWTVQFASDDLHRGPAETLNLPAPTDWCKSDDPRLKYYSGEALYKGSFSLPDNAPDNLQLDLGKVGVIAKVKVNGQYVGGVWTEPYRLDISKAAKKGANSIEIELCNTWVNRIIGDRQLPEKERRVRARFTNFDNDKQLQASGLLAPVKIVSE